MKKYLLMIVLLLTGMVQAWTQAQTTLVKSVPLNTSMALIELPGEVSTTNWDKDYARVTVTIEVTNSSEEILKKLVAVGRYDINSEDKEGEFLIHMPKVAHHVTIKGIELDERLKFEVQLPKGFEAKIQKPEFYSGSETL